MTRSECAFIGAIAAILMFCALLVAAWDVAVVFAVIALLCAGAAIVGRGDR